MSKSLRENMGAKLLTDFERLGPRYLELEFEQDPERARAYCSRIESAMQVIVKKFVSSSLPAKKRSTPVKALQNSHEVRTGRSSRRHTKLRQGLLIEAVILRHLIREQRATTIQALFENLLSLRLVEPQSKPALTSRLNRMKNEARLIDWSKRSRAQEIVITENGVARSTELMEKLLQKREIQHLQKHASWMFDTSNQSNVVLLRPTGAS